MAQAGWKADLPKTYLTNDAFALRTGAAQLRGDPAGQSLRPSRLCLVGRKQRVAEAALISTGVRMAGSDTYKVPKLQPISQCEVAFFGQCSVSLRSPLLF